MEKTSYGYEIGERYDRRFGTFLPVSRTAIYSSLDRLEHVGLIKALPPASGSVVRGRRVRVNYEPVNGAERLHARWLSSPINHDHWHLDLIARIATAHLQGSAPIGDLLSRYAQHAEMHSQRIDALIRDRTTAAGAHLHAPAMLLLIEQRIVVTAQLNWVSSARDQLKATSDYE